MLSLYVTCTPIAPYIGQRHYDWRNNYKQISGNNSKICGKVCFPKMNIVSSDQLLVFQAIAILYFKQFY